MNVGEMKVFTNPINISEETHKHVVEMLLGAIEFTAAHFKKWDAYVDFDISEDDDKPLLPRGLLVGALLVAASDTDHYWNLLLSKGEDSTLSVSYRRDCDDETIGEFVISLLGRKIDGKRSYRFGYDRRGNLLYGEDALSFGWVLGLTQEEIWGEFYSMIAKA